MPNIRARTQLKQLRALSSTYDVLYCFWPHIHPFPDVDKPVVCTYQDTTLLDFPEILGGYVAAQEVENARRWLSESHRVIVSSEATRNRLVQLFGTPNEKTQLIYHNIMPRTSFAQKTIFSDVQVKLPPRYVIYPANINVHKNHETLLIAWSRFAGRFDLPLVLVGEGTQIFSVDWTQKRNEYWRHDHLYGLTNRLGLERGTAVYGLGYVSDDMISTLMKNATALILPTLSEGGGSYPLEEALNYGVPVVCSDIPVIQEHMRQRSAAPVWFDPLLPETIVQAVEDLVKNYGHYKAAAQAAMNDTRPTWNSIAAQYADVLTQAAHRQE